MVPVSGGAGAVAVAPARYRDAVPALFAAREHCARRTFEFFAVAIRNVNTRRAYGRGAADFSAWCAGRGINDVRQVQPVHVAAYAESLQVAAASVTQRLAALRMLFDWLVVGQVVGSNPAASVRGPRHSSKVGKTPVLSAQEVRAVLDGIDGSNPIGARDRALLGLMVYTFARVGATVALRVEDVYRQGERTWVRLHEKGGKRHEVPCNHKLATLLHGYIDAAPPTGPKGWLFRSAVGRTGVLSDRQLSQSDVFRMIARRTAAVAVLGKFGCHSFRATGITEYLRSGGRLDVAQALANHESARTTGLYDRRVHKIAQEEVERVSF